MIKMGDRVNKITKLFVESRADIDTTRKMLVSRFQVLVCVKQSNKVPGDIFASILSEGSVGAGVSFLIFLL